MKNKIAIYVLAALALYGCGEWNEDGSDLRNYIRDKHPYCQLKKVELSTPFGYLANDTIKGEVWIYTSYLHKSSVRGVCVNCE